MKPERVPLVDLAAGIRPLRQAILDALARVVDSAGFVGGTAVSDFERDFAAFCTAPQAVAVGSGTDALLLTLRALDIGPGDEVITAPNSFFATAEAIALAGATPVFADVHDDSLCLDAAAVGRAITARTRAVIPVHLYGQCADMAALRAVVGGSRIALIEDACQAHGATRGGARAGSLGDAAAFSFYPSKNLGALGEGGCITTASDELAERARALRDHGQRRKHQHQWVGYNARLDALQCAVLGVKLAHLEAAIEARRALAERYRRGLAARGVRCVGEAAGNRHVYHLFVVRVPERDRVQARLREHAIDSAVHYPTPIHLQPAFAHLGLGPGSFPVAERAAGEILSLPMYPELAPAAVDRVVAAL